MRKWTGCFAVGLLLAAAAPARADVISVTYGAAGAQSASKSILQAATTIGTESFDTRSSGTFTTNFGTGGAITGTYTGAQIVPADQYGGAGGTGNYIEALGNTAGYTISFATTGVPGVNYFGFWLSALDSGNQVVFKRAGNTVGTYSPSNVTAAINSCNGANAYCGNPTANFSGQDAGQQFAFVNFVDLNGFFDEIDLFENPSVGNYESDNHTVAYCANPSACGGVAAVPEPMSLAIIGAGLASVAFLNYRRKRL